MKYRQGFVSNSSSSSFIIAYNQKTIGNECKTCGHITNDFTDFLSKSNNEDTELRSEDTDNIKAFIKDECFMYYENAEEQIKKALSIVEKLSEEGWKMIECDIAYEDTFIEQELRSLVTQGNIIIIYENN
jgi:hypothetical protein